MTKYAIEYSFGDKEISEIIAHEHCQEFYNFMESNGFKRRTGTFFLGGKDMTIVDAFLTAQKAKKMFNRITVMAQVSLLRITNIDDLKKI